MFDFAAVGLPLAACGLIYLVLVGWRLLPKDRGVGNSGAAIHRFSIEEYLIEAKVPEGSTLAHGLELRFGPRYLSRYGPSIIPSSAYERNRGRHPG